MSDSNAVIRVKGRVKWMNVNCGYGMLTQEGSDEDVFFHRTELKVEGFSYVPPNVKVTFDLVKGEPRGNSNGLKAKDVQLDLD